MSIPSRRQSEDGEAAHTPFAGTARLFPPRAATLPLVGWMYATEVLVILPMTSSAMMGGLRWMLSR